jgi:AcrR family transcriptional regulator
MPRADDIRTTAIHLFAEQGYRGTSMKDIASALSIRAPSLYNHLQSKQDLLREVMLGSMEQLDSSVRAAMSTSEDTVVKVRRGTEAHVLHQALHPDEIRIGNREIPSLDEPHRGRLLADRARYAHMWIDLIERGITEGVLHTPSPKLTAFGILEMGIGVANWFKPGGPMSAGEIAMRYGDIALLMVGAKTTGNASAPSAEPASTSA